MQKSLFIIPEIVFIYVSYKHFVLINAGWMIDFFTPGSSMSVEEAYLYGLNNIFDLL